MKLFYSEKARQRDLQNAVNKALQENNKFLQAMYGRNLFGTYQSLGNEDDPLDYGYNFNANLYSIISWIYNRASDIPLQVCKGYGDDKEVLEDHELLELIDCPNPQEGKKEFFQKFYGMFDVFGNSYIYAPVMDTGMNRGKFTEMWVMPSNKVEIKSGAWYEPIKGYVIDEDWEHNEMSPREVLHCKYPNLDFDQGQEWYGLSPLQVALNRLKADKQREETQYKSYENAGAQGIVSRKRANEQSYMQVDQQDRIQRSLNNRLKNKDNRVMFSADELVYQQLGLTSHDMQLIEDAKWSLKTLCNLYHVPSQLFNDSESSTYNNMKEARKSAIINAVLPKVNMFCTEFNRHFVKGWEDDIYLEPDTSGIEELQADKKEMVEWLEKAPLTENEKRDLLGFSSDPELEDLYLVNSGKVPLEQLQALNIMNDLNEV
jgi:HK97 family phage portal protein